MVDDSESDSESTGGRMILGTDDNIDQPTDSLSQLGTELQIVMDPPLRGRSD